MRRRDSKSRYWAGAPILWALLWAVCLGSCVEAKSVICEDGRTCPQGTVCAPELERCVNPEQVDLCEGAAEGDPCTLPGPAVPHHCHLGYCVPAPYCGDGVVDGLEECDCGTDPMNLPAGCLLPNDDDQPDACRRDCVWAHCGDGVLDAGEQCDDGNDAPGDGCSASCEFESCGNGLVEGNEVCDDGNNVSGDGCRDDCRSDETCGNRIVDHSAGEQCDCGTDPSNLPGGCTAENGPGPPGTCRSDCLLARCGNGMLDPDEACDDGNNVSGDGCSGDCRSLEVCGNGVADYGAGEQCDDGNLRSNDGCSSGCTLENAVWRRYTPPAEPGRSMPAMAYDAGRGITVLFGGYVDGSYNDETWEYDGLRWQRIPTATTPPARWGASMAYDPVSQRIVMFGGSQLADTWEYDGVNWQQVFPPSAPGPRYGHVMVHSAGRNRIVLFGGRAPGYVAMDDTWLYNASANTWTQLALTASPPGRTEFAMAYHPGVGRVVLHGGDLLGSGFAGDQWELADGATTWNLVTPAGAPGFRYRHAMTYDAARSRVVLFGGWGNGYPTDAWEYNGTSWTVVPSLVPPPGRTKFGMVFDTGRGRIVVHGGSGQFETLNDTWERAGTEWVEVDTRKLPPTRYYHALAYDHQRERMVLFGGYDGVADLDDTWEFADAWEERLPATAPSPRGLADLTYDRLTGRLVLYGGTAPAAFTSPEQDTWEYDGTNWSQALSASPPGRRSEHAQAYDPVNDLVVVHGGNTAADILSDLWSYEAQTDTWTQGVDDAATQRSNHRMVYHAGLHRLFVYGGSFWNSLKSDTWAYDGVAQTWQALAPAVAPSARELFAMAYDPIRDVVVLHGGREGSFLGYTSLSDTWEYAHDDWAQAATVLSPGLQFGHAMAYHAKRRSLFMVGAGAQSVETWEYLMTSTWPAEDCDTVGDDDGDGLADCDDPDCRYDPDCQPAEVCDNGADDDGDGLVDCADPGCGGLPCNTTPGHTCVAGACAAP